MPEKHKGVEPTDDDVTEATSKEAADGEEAASPEEKEAEAGGDVSEEISETGLPEGTSRELQALFEEITAEISRLENPLTLEKGTVGPQVDAAGECFCGECGHEASHTGGDPCVDKFCPKCSAKMMARSQEKENLLARFRKALYYVGDKVTEFVRPNSTGLADLNIDEVAKTGSSFFTVKQADGRYRWVSISSTAFLDREDEIVSSLAIARSAVHQTGRGPLLFWHEKKIELGTCDFALHDGLCLIESGLWHDSKVGVAARKETAKHPERWRVSIGFYPEDATTEVNAKVGNRTVKAVYNGMLVVERSQLPAEYSANPFSRIDTQGGITMLATKEKALAELLGAEMAAKFAAQVDDINAMSTDKSAVFKSTDVSNSNGGLILQLKGLIDVETDPDKKAILIAAGEGLSYIHPATEEQKDTMVRDGLAILLESLPECEVKNAVAAALAVKAGHADENDDEDSDEDDAEKSVKGEDATKSTVSDEVLVTTLKSMVDIVTALGEEVKLLKADKENTTRGSDHRPSTSKDNVNPDAVVTVPNDKPPNKGIQVIDSMIGSLLPGFGTEE